MNGLYKALLQTIHLKDISIWGLKYSVFNSPKKGTVNCNMFLYPQWAKNLITIDLQCCNESLFYMY